MTLLSNTVSKEGSGNSPVLQSRPITPRTLVAQQRALLKRPVGQTEARPEVAKIAAMAMNFIFAVGVNGLMRLGYLL